MGTDLPTPHRARIDPPPPRAPARLPWVGAGFSLLRDPTGYLAETRRRLGDTYVVDAFGRRLLFLFSAAGLQALYALPENRASFGLATLHLLRHKLPVELLVGRRNGPRTLFGADEVPRYVRNLEAAMDRELARLDERDELDVFATARRIGHRLGLASWLGRDAVADDTFARLVPLFDGLDSADAFVRPWQAFRTAATGHRRERALVRRLEDEIIALRRRRAGAAETSTREAETGDAGDGFLETIHGSYADLPAAERESATARDVILLHLGSQSNLWAALAWTIVEVVQRPDLVQAIRDGDDDLLERAASEAIRLAQRSITLRLVLEPLEIDDGRARWRVDPGVLLATMLPVTNRTAAPGLASFDARHYEGRRLAAWVPVAAREQVSTFGHGVHSCPAQRFSITAIRIAVRRLVERYDLDPDFARPVARRSQIGGVARAARPCRVRYDRRGAGPGALRPSRATTA